MLVVVGLLAAGVLGGRELVESFRVAAQARQVDQFDAAVNTFKLKYGGLPGDINGLKAQQLGLPGDGGNPLNYYGANSNGMIDCCAFTFDGFGYTFGSERQYFWPQLAAARLVEGSYNSSSIAYPASVRPGGNLPAMRLNPNFGILPMTMPTLGDGNWWVFGARLWDWSIMSSIDGGGVVVPSLTPAQAKQLDQRMDDGKPGTGRMRAVQICGYACEGVYGRAVLRNDTNATSGPYSGSGVGVTNCVQTGGADYDLTQAGVNCIIAVKMQ